MYSRDSSWKKRGSDLYDRSKSQMVDHAPHHNWPRKQRSAWSGFLAESFKNKRMFFARSAAFFAVLVLIAFATTDYTGATLTRNANHSDVEVAQTTAAVESNVSNSEVATASTDASIVIAPAGVAVENSAGLVDQTSNGKSSSLTIADGEASSNETTNSLSTGCCIWPVHGRITSQTTRWHMAIDIMAPYWTPVVAGDGGRVIAAGWDRTGYGYRMMIDHGGGLSTLYAHLSRYYYDYGDYVEKNTVIGRVGSTGYSSGPHLHFEVRVNNYRENPWNWLP